MYFFFNIFLIIKINYVLKSLISVFITLYLHKINFFIILIVTVVKENHIIKLALDREENRKYHDTSELNKYIKTLVGQNISFSRFVILACEYALLNMETSNDIDKQKKN